MSVFSEHTNQLKAAEAFSKQSKRFDQLYGQDAIIEYKRSRVREHILQHLHGDRMLELNCGSGEDALFFAAKGMHVHATDISEGMLEVMNEKLQNFSDKKFISSELCSFTDLKKLKERGPVDHIYSNFGGLNCTGELEKVLKDLTPLVKPGGIVTLVIISKFCLWENLLVFRGRFKTAFRRWFSAKGRKAHVEGSFFKCWYYRPSFVIKKMKSDFDLVSLEGLCTIVPPSYFEHFAEKHPSVFSFLKKQEDRLKAKWPWRVVGDYFIVSMRRKAGM